MSSINANATVTLTVNGKQAQDMLDNLKKKSVELEKAIDNAAKAGDKTKLTRLQRELRQISRQIAQIESATVGVEKVLHNLDKATPKELNRALSQLKKQLNSMERGTEAWNRQCESIKRVKAEIDRVNAEMRVGESRWESFNRKLNDWQMSIMGAAAAVTGLVMAGRSAVKTYAEIDAEMANVRKFTGMDAEQVRTLNEEFKKMNTRTSREELNKLAEEAGKLGKQSQEDVLGFVRAADKINVALDELGDGATLTLSKLTNIFGDEKRLGTEKALLAVGSVINELSQNCTASAPYLANFAQRMAGVGAQARMTIPEIMGLAAVLDSQGQKVEMSSTAVSKVIMDMFKQQDQIVKATGLNAQKFKETVTRNTNEGLLMLLEQLHSLGNIDVLAPVFKDMGENGARAAQVIAALAGNIDMIRWEQQEANKAFNEATSVTKEFDVQNNTVQAGLDKARKRVYELAAELGQKLHPVMRHVISSTTLLLRFLSMMVDFFIKNKAEIVTVTAVFAAYAVAVNMATIRTKLHTAAVMIQNAAIKTMNVLIPIANVMLNGMKLAYERLVWQTRGANTAQQAYNKSLIALRNNAAAAKTAYALLAVAVAAVAIAVVKYIKSRQTEAQVERTMNNIRKEAAQRASEQISKVRQLEAAARDETLSLDERYKAVNKLNGIIPSYNASLDRTTGKYRANKKALDSYINSLIQMYEVMGAKEKLQDIGRQRVELELEKKDLEEQRTETLKQNTPKFNHPQTSSGAMAPASYYQQMGTSGAIAGLDQRIGSVNRKLTVLEATEKRINKLYGEKINKSVVKDLQEEEIEEPHGTPAATGTTTSTHGGSDKKNEDKFKTEKQWKEKEEALNRIAYATGKKNYEDYTNRMLEIEQQYHEKILARTDLTEQERLNAEVGANEAIKKLEEQQRTTNAQAEENFYNDLVATQRQRYIDGETDQEVYHETLELLELQHLKRRLSIFKEGTKEFSQAQQAYQEKVIADQEHRRKEAEEKEKRMYERLQKLKDDYFGPNREERYIQYNADLLGLKEVYDLEVMAAGDNAKEKLRIEEAYQKAKQAIRQKYGIDELEENRNFLEEWNEEVMEWMQSDLGKAVTGSLDVITSSMSALFSQMSQMIQAETDIQTAAIEKRYKSEISNAEGNNYIVKKLEKQKEAEIAKVKREANKKMFAMQVIQAVAQTATSALNAYSSAAAIPLIGWTLAPVAAAMAVAAGMLQVAAIKKQQQASEAQGYAEGGFTPEGGKYEVAGVVHKGEWVASQRLLQSPVARPMIEALDYAQRTNTIGSLRSEDVSRSISPNYAQSQAQSPTVIVQSSPDAQAEIAAAGIAMREYAAVIRQLKERLDEPFVTVNTVSGDNGIKQAQDEYDKLMRNKTPKSRRK